MRSKGPLPQPQPQPLAPHARDGPQGSGDRRLPPPKLPLQQAPGGPPGDGGDRGDSGGDGDATPQDTDQDYHDQNLVVLTEIQTPVEMTTGKAVGIVPRFP